MGKGVAILNRVTGQDLGNKVTLGEGASLVASQGKGGRESQEARAGVLCRSESSQEASVWPRPTGQRRTLPGTDSHEAGCYHAKGPGVLSGWRAFPSSFSGGSH